jgi:hypothetical protein
MTPKKLILKPLRGSKSPLFEVKKLSAKYHHKVALKLFLLKNGPKPIQAGH